MTGVTIDIDIDVPKGPRWAPRNPGGLPKPKGGDSFDLGQWNRDIALLLVPVRLETTFVDGPKNPELRIRILPDALTVLGAAPPTANELDIALDFWTKYHGDADAAKRAATWRWFARTLGSQRAGYLARLTRPAVAADGRLTFPKVTAEPDRPAFASLLPDRWMATGWIGEKVVFQAVSRPVVRPLATSPDPEASTITIGTTGLKIDPATAWLFDYKVAVDRGMAITVPLVGDASPAAGGVSTLVVLGIDESQKPTSTADDLTALFDNHLRSAGLAFVPQGTATNNTDTVEAGLRHHEAELAELEDRELNPYLADIDDNASRFARALGLADVELFGRLAHGTDLQHARSRDMRIALFEVVLGTYCRKLLARNVKGAAELGSGLDETTIAALRSWFVTWVCGGAPVPAIRVGNQPYGVLPVMARGKAAPSSLTKQHLVAVIDLLIEEWRTALLSVPTLDHNATDTVDDEAELRDAVTAVLANSPHARRITVRTAVDWSDQPRPVVERPLLNRQQISGRLDPGDIGNGSGNLPLELLTGGFRWEYDDLIETLETTYGPTVKVLYDAVLQELIPPHRAVDDILNPILRARPTPVGGLEPGQFPADDGDIRGIEEQLAIWVQTDLSIDDPRAINVEFAEVFPELHEFCADVIAELERHELRQRPLRWLGVPGLDGVLGRNDLQLLLTKFSASDPVWQRSVVQDDEPPGGTTTAVYLTNLSDRLWPFTDDRPGPIDLDPIPGTDFPGPGGIELPSVVLPPAFIAASPLLYQLLEATISQGANRVERSEAVARLAAAEPDELDWLLRETLGLGTNRLDAWHTSLATERLSALRDQEPTGVYVGSFGFVLDLNPSAEFESNGFIHAPSLAHAASAAVLRSGWLARGDENPESPAAIDLASDRVRDAEWLLSGVRHGQDLGDLLGVRFERGLHDQDLDVAIRPLRLAVGEADGLGELAGEQPVDGARLLDLHRAGDLADTIANLGLSSNEHDDLVGLLDGITSGFDAVDDATTFEMVHQLVVGNIDRAAAVVDGMGPNGGVPPELAGIRTPRNALTIDTRALVLIEAGSRSDGQSWGSGTRDLFDPELEAWAVTMMPAAGDVGWVVVDTDGKHIPMNLGQLGLSALDACYLANDDPRTVSAGLRQLIALADQGTTIAELRLGDRGSQPVSLTEFQLLAVELRRFIHEATPADARALAGAADTQTVSTNEGTIPVHVTQALADQLALFTRVDGSTSWADIDSTDVAALCRIGLTPSPNADPTEDFAAVLGHLERRRAMHDGVENPNTIAGVRNQVAALIGGRTPVLIAFEAPDAGGVQLDDVLATDEDIDDWFDLLASVRPNVANLWRAVSLGGLLGIPPPALLAGQYPLLPGDSWAALHRPTADTGSRIVVAALQHGTIEPAASVVGLVIDQWAERIPLDDQLTGVAFHYDAPSAQAPQSMLLAVPPEGSPWSTDLVLETLLETIEWAQLRTVALDDLGDYGQALPTTFVEAALDYQPPEGVTT